MTEAQKLEEIIVLISFLQKYIENNVKASFTDLAFSLEIVIKDFLNVFEEKQSEYINANRIKSNYPAIDLISIDKKIVVQVTTNADSVKVKKTIETCVSSGLTYSKLIIIGFINHSKSKYDKVEIVGVDYLINLVKHGSYKQKDMIYEILHRQIPLNVLNPKSDEMCFDVVFDVINRSAIRDDSRSEGDYCDMVKGLKEIKEIITVGEIAGKSIRAKPLSGYNPYNQSLLSLIEYKVSGIIQICNINKDASDFICLGYQERERIDVLKDDIVKLSNELSLKMGLSKTIIK